MSTLLGYMYLHMPPTFKFLLRMDGWIEILRLFNSILVISGRCEDDNESLVRIGGSRTGWGACIRKFLAQSRIEPTRGDSL